MEESALRRALSGLVAEITTPRTNQPTITVLAGREEPASKSADTRGVQEQLDHLRVAIKYLLFDLEATRRENACLRGMIEHHSCEPEHED